MSRSNGFERLLKLAHRHPRPSPRWHRPEYADPDYSRRFYSIYEENSSESRSETIEFLKSLIDPGQRLLDIGCGGGAFGRAMAHLGIRVTGIDVGPYPIEQAVQNSEKVPVEPVWICSNVFDFESEQSFDLIVLLGSQLQEFPPDELELLFRKVQSLLAPNGKFVSVVQRLSPNEREYSSYWYLPEQCLYTDKKALVLGENFYYPEERVRILREYALEIPSGRILVGGSTEKEYQPEELAEYAQKAGLRLTTTYGGFDQSSPTPDSSHLIFIMEQG